MPERLSALFDASTLLLLCQMQALVVLCLSFHLLYTHARMLSFGHAVLSGAGGYGAAWVMNAWAVPLPLLPLAGAGAGMLVASLVAPLLARSGGPAFAVGTLAIGELVHQLALTLPAWAGGERGITLDRSAGPALGSWGFGPQWQVHAVVLAWTLLMALALKAVLASPLGRASRAVADNATRATAMGLDPARVRAQVIVLSAAMAGVGGALSAINLETVGAAAFSSARSAEVLLFTLIGSLLLPSAGPASAVLGGLLGGALSLVLPRWTPAWPLHLGLLFIWVTKPRRPGRSSAMARAGLVAQWVACVVLVEIAQASAFDAGAGAGTVGRWLGALTALERGAWALLALAVLLSAELPRAWRRRRPNGRNGSLSYGGQRNGEGGRTTRPPGFNATD